LRHLLLVLASDLLLSGGEAKDLLAFSCQGLFTQDERLRSLHYLSFESIILGSEGIYLLEEYIPLLYQDHHVILGVLL
jgi:hypothetical protein